jgi:hypothetical protein
MGCAIVRTAHARLYPSWSTLDRRRPWLRQGGRGRDMQEPGAQGSSSVWRVERGIYISTI